MRNQKIRRREFMKTVAFVGAASVLRGSSKTSAGQEARKPDILLIMPDQMRGDCLSILGHPAVHTPTLDELVRHGVLFRRAYTPVASCIV